MRGLPASSPAIRIRQGETVVAQAWSNTATQLWGYFRVVYDDGTDDAFTLDRLLLLNNRVQGNLTSKSVAKEDGYIVSGQICQVSGVANQATQRGQCYVRAFVVNEPGSAEALSAGGCRAMLCMGYIYSGVDVALGMMVEPGPAGGHGAITRVSLASVAGGGTAGKVLAAVPAGAFWRWIAGRVVYTASATVGNRNYGLRFRDASGNIYLESILTGNVATTLKGEFEFGENFTSEASSALANTTASVETPSPDRILPAGHDLFAFDNTNVDVADTVVLESLVEEWVMPN